ncbi:hypothetical protein QOZ80_7AG0567380 [Eleusine coracana subsp. coracana]|nr:hypothetical protein QOZ80_7AG0567380 [Eleusine coracana subsp. coracana]
MPLRPGLATAGAARMSASSTPPGDGTAGDGVDRLSGLPEGLLLDIVSRLGCAREAARTSVLSHCWHGLWAELRELIFDDVGADALENVLARVRPNLNRLDIVGVEFPWDRSPTATAAQTTARISSLLRAADRLAPAELVVRLSNYLNYGFLALAGAEIVKFEMPCFERAASFVLNLSTLEFTLPPAGEFASLEQLTMALDTVDLGELVPRCPRLRKLKVDFRRFVRNTVTVDSKSLQELDLMFMPNMETIGVVILAPELNKFRLVSLMSGVPTISLSAPKVAEFMLEYIYEQCQSRYRTSAERSFAQEVALLPVNDFSVLKLSTGTQGHVFGPLALKLLWIRTSIQRLKLILMADSYVDCSDCDCDQHGGWRNERVSLPELEDVEIQGFSAADHEVDFLKLLLGSSPMLKRMNVKLYADEVSPSEEEGCRKLHSIFEANASVKCNVYGKSGDQITFA